MSKIVKKCPWSPEASKLHLSLRQLVKKCHFLKACHFLENLLSGPRSPEWQKLWKSHIFKHNRSFFPRRLTFFAIWWPISPYCRTFLEPDVAKPSTFRTLDPSNIGKNDTLCKWRLQNVAKRANLSMRPAEIVAKYSNLGARCA